MKTIIAPRRVSADDWRAYAACRTAPVDLHFPVGDTGSSLLQIEEARRICHRCPVMLLCQDWALTTREEYGVWGGLSENERRNVLRHRARNAAKTRKAASA